MCGEGTPERIIIDVDYKCFGVAVLFFNRHMA
jgi:hypothetical protein